MRTSPAISILAVLLGACLPLEPPRPDPVIAAIDPATAAPGQEVTITGSELGEAQSTSKVTFAGVPAGTAVSWSDVEIKVAVPELEAGDVSVVVTVKGASSEPATFTVAAAPIPSITSIEPAEALPGEAVTITGSAFGAERGPEDTVVFASEVDAADGITSWSDTEIQVTIPDGAVTGDVTVTAGGVTSEPFPYHVGGEPEPDAGPTGPTLTDLQEQIFTPICARAECHDSQTARSGMVLEAGLAYANTVNVPSTERPAMMRVAPGDPNQSYLYLKISRPLPPDGDRMPQALPPLSDHLIGLVREWIEAGAMND